MSPRVSVFIVPVLLASASAAHAEDVVASSPPEPAGERSWRTPTFNLAPPGDDSGFLSPDGFIGVSAGYAWHRGKIEASGARADLGGAFAHDTAGFALEGGADYGFGRFGIGTGYYADHMPWGVALAGAVIGSAVFHGPLAGDDVYYEMRTELSQLPLTVFYEQRVPLPGPLGEIRFGPVVGGTVNVLSAHYAQGRYTDAAVAFTYGARVVYEARLGRETRLRVAYEYDRSSPTDYDLGFRLRLGERETHRITVGVTVMF